jgi:hypothetical protein
MRAQRREEEPDTHAQDDTTIRDRHPAQVCAGSAECRSHRIIHDWGQIHGSHSFVFLDLSPYLVCDRLDPRSLGQFQIGTEDGSEFLGCYEEFVRVPDEAVSYSVSLGFELDADWDQA